MRALLIAVGNPLRGDDGVAERVLSLIPVADDLARMSVFNLTPELAQQVAQHDLVVIIDADTSAETVAITPVETEPELAPQPITSHGLTPDALVTLARRLYQFSGAALVCRIPAFEFAAPFRLGRRAASGAELAAQLISAHLFECAARRR